MNSPIDVILSFVGTRDPLAEDATDGPIVTLYQYLRETGSDPHFAYVFPTQGCGGINETFPRLNDLIEYLKDLGMNTERIIHSTLVITDPRDYHKIMEFLERTLLEIISEVAQRGVTPTFHVNVSSGTSQMHTAWLIAGSYGLIPGARYYQVAPPSRDKLDPYHRVEEIKPHFIRERTVVQQVKKMMELGLYDMAGQSAAELEKITPDPGRAVFATYIKRLMEAYNCWDNLNYDDAKSQIETVYRDKGRGAFTELRGFLESQLAVLRRLNSARDARSAVIVDLYHNARRANLRGAYADCLARVYRLYEEVLYQRLEAIGVTPLDLESSANKKGHVNTLLKKRMGDQPFYIGAHQAETILLEQDEEAKSFHESIQNPMGK